MNFIKFAVYAEGVLESIQAIKVTSTSCDFRAEIDQVSAPLFMRTEIDGKLLEATSRQHFYSYYDAI